jgi:hypothetical protein
VVFWFIALFLQGTSGGPSQPEVKPNIGNAIQSVTSDNNQAQSNSQFVNNGPSYNQRQSGPGSGPTGTGGPGEDDVVYLSELNWVSEVEVLLVDVTCAKRSPYMDMIVDQ